MFTYKRSIGLILGFGVAFALCSCSVPDEVPESSETETSVSSSAAEATTSHAPEEVSGPQIVFSGELPEVGEAFDRTVDMSGVNVMGFDEWYGTCHTDEYGYSNWTFYNSDDEVIGEMFGWDCADQPRIFVRDMDNDGMNELLCADTFNADGADRLYIYRMGNGSVEEGYVDDIKLESRYGLEGQLCVMAYDEFFDEYTDSMYFQYYYAEQGDGIYEITYDDFTFNKYEYVDYYDVD